MGALLENDAKVTTLHVHRCGVLEAYALGSCLEVSPLHLPVLVAFRDLFLFFC